MSDETTTTDEQIDEAGVAIGVHVVLMSDGQFGIQATGEPTLGEMQMLLSRALTSIECRMVGETITAMQKQNESRIITPKR